MTRPPKWRRVEFIPRIQRFVPLGVDSKELRENTLRIEEVEAIRLRDLEKLEQKECAQRMEISRQTFQRVLKAGREKIADSLVTGKAIQIRGGNFTRNICLVRCLDCNKEWRESYENFEKVISGDYNCPDCKSKNIICSDSENKNFCRRNCWRRGRRGGRGGRDGRDGKRNI